MDSEDSLVIWRKGEDIDYEEEKVFFEEEKFENIYVNGDSALEGSMLISNVFKDRVFSDIKGDKYE